MVEENECVNALKRATSISTLALNTTNMINDGVNALKRATSISTEKMYRIQKMK